MSGIILHHYPTSPYAEMVRIALGHKGLAWESCEQSVILPRPELMALTGGYRRIPVLQIGADIYCDTHAILRALDRLAPEPPERGGLGWIVRGYAERAWFGVTVGVIFGARGASVPEAFIKDREQLSGRPFDVAAMTAAAPLLRGQWRAHAALLQGQLEDGRAFLTGAAPSLVDIGAYLNIWFLRHGLPEAYAELTAGLPALNEWADRVAAIGHGRSTAITPAEALARARASEPTPPPASDPHDAQGLAPGQTVAVMADDYGRDPIVGVITHVSAHAITLLREPAETGPIAVHFPRAGFFVRPV